MHFNFTIEGNLAATPELRYSKNGTPVCQLRLMRTARFLRDGKWADGATISLSVDCWRRLAERAAELNKGDTVVVEVSDDLHGEVYQGRAQLRATARSVALSMRWHGATSQRPPRPDDATTVVPATGGYDTSAANGYVGPADHDTDPDSAPVAVAASPAVVRPTRARSKARVTSAG
jgi:single-strand DNA-binding protein